MQSPELHAHLEQRYGVRVTAISQLDAGVFRVDLAQRPAWVARVFSPARAPEDVGQDAMLLRALERAGFPAERCADAEPASTLDGRGVLVTELVPAGPPLRPGRTFAILGALLGRLHAHPADRVRAGGAWHHLSFSGGPREEIAAAGALLDEAVPRVEVRELPLLDWLRDEVDRADDCSDLPHALVHPDFVPVNAIPTPDEWLVVVDWTGAGKGPRLWSIGFLLWAAGSRNPKLLEVVISRYRRHVELTPEELARLSGAIAGRPLMLEVWAFCNGRRELRGATERVREANELADAIAARSRRAFEARDGPGS